MILPLSSYSSWDQEKSCILFLEKYFSTIEKTYFYHKTSRVSNKNPNITSRLLKDDFISWIRIMLANNARKYTKNHFRMEWSLLNSYCGYAWVFIFHFILLHLVRTNLGGKETLNSQELTVSSVIISMTCCLQETIFSVSEKCYLRKGIQTFYICLILHNMKTKLSRIRGIWRFFFKMTQSILPMGDTPLD